MLCNFKYIKTSAVVCLLVLPLLFSGCMDNEGQPGANPDLKPEKVIEEWKGTVDLNILCVGDIMEHSSQITAQYDGNTGEYDFSNNYKYVKNYIAEADLALCNLETTFAGQPYTGYPNFSAPDKLAEDLKNTGFDVVITANNHMMDKGKNGLLRTVDVLQESGLQTAGSRKNTNEPRFAISEVKGVKIATVAYTYETPASGESTGLNGVVIPKDAAELINSFNAETLSEDLSKIRDTCRKAREAGAEVVVLYYHWGNEYQTTASDIQRQIAKYSVEDIGADVVFASHPHVLQEMEYYQKKSKAGETVNVPVFFSMGNFISNQRQETLSNRYTETGIIAKAMLTYDKDKKAVTNATMDRIPTWVDRYKYGNKLVYEIIPLDENLASNETLIKSGHLSRAEQAWEDANGILKFN